MVHHESFDAGFDDDDLNAECTELHTISITYHIRHDACDTSDDDLHLDFPSSA